MFRHRPGCSKVSVSPIHARRSRDKSSAADANHGSSCGPLPGRSEIRAELVERIRRAIAEGCYETPEKWEAALNSLYQRLQDA